MLGLGRTASQPTEPSAVIAHLRQQRAAMARRSLEAFIEFVLKDEQTGAPVRMCAMHTEWHRFLDDEARAVILAHVEAAKTTSISIARTLHELGRDPTLRCAIVSNTHGQASKILRTIAAYIEKSVELHEVFPGLLPGEPWQDGAITVQRHTLSKDPSVQAFGVHGAIIGSRIDRLIIDDAVDFENSRTEEQRKQLVQWVDASCLGRLTGRGRVTAVGTAFHPADLLHVLQARGWATRRYPVEDEQGNPRWPERWPAARIEAKRLELGPAEAARQLDVEVRDDQTSIIKMEWIEHAIACGTKPTLLSRTDQGKPYLLSKGLARVVVGVDLAVSKKETSDLTAIVIVLVHPDKSRELLSVETGRMHGPEIVDAILDAHLRFAPSAIVIEANAAQAYVGQWLKKMPFDIPIQQFTTGRGENSLQWRVEQVAAELGRGQWRIPSVMGKIRDKETGLLVRDLLAYSPTGHCPDRVAALCFAQFGCELASHRAGFVPFDSMRR